MSAIYSVAMLFNVGVLLNTWISADEMTNATYVFTFVLSILGIIAKIMDIRNKRKEGQIHDKKLKR